MLNASSKAPVKHYNFGDLPTLTDYPSLCIFFNRTDILSRTRAIFLSIKMGRMVKVANTVICCQR